MNALSNVDIMDILNEFNISIGGIFSKDKIPKLIADKFYIINMQNSTEGNGTHWVVLYYNGVDNFYFDAFGFICPKEIEDKLIKYTYSKKQIQDVNSSSCGWYCIAFIKFLYKRSFKKDFYDCFINLFSKDTKNNEVILKQILDN
jgi:hypothetical protein